MKGFVGNLFRENVSRKCRVCQLSKLLLLTPIDFVGCTSKAVVAGWNDFRLCLTQKQNKLLFLPLEHQNSLNDEEDCVVVMQAFLAGRIRDPVSHGENSKHLPINSSYL